MVSLLNTPGFRDRTLPVSVEAWHAMVERGVAPKRAELVRGVIIEKMSKSILHTKLAARLFRMFSEVLEPGYWVRKEEPITTRDSEPEPDLSVVVGAEADYSAHPSTACLVVEISVSSLAEDREMASIYAEAGVEEFWIVLGKENAVEVYRDPVRGIYATLEKRSVGENLTSKALPSLKLDLEVLFAGLK